MYVMYFIMAITIFSTLASAYKVLTSFEAKARLTSFGCMIISLSVTGEVAGRVGYVYMTIMAPSGKLLSSSQIFGLMLVIGILFLLPKAFDFVVNILTRNRENKKYKYVVEKNDNITAADLFEQATYN